jgi:hypothetical protein
MVVLIGNILLVDNIFCNPSYSELLLDGTSRDDDVVVVVVLLMTAMC